MRNINLWTYSKDTPLYDWFRHDKIFHSQYLNSHVSDLLRYLSLYKFGGTYLDLDVVVQQNFNDIPSNYAGAESENFVAAGAINFDYNGIGHEIAELCVRYCLMFMSIFYRFFHLHIKYSLNSNLFYATRACIKYL